MKIHFVGIGGISMSALAKLSQNKNTQISGSDVQPDSSALFENTAIKFLGSHDKKNVVGADLVVYTAAVGANNVELAEAKRLAIPTMDRAQYLAEIEKTFEKSVAVSGTHGKTTTSAMIGDCVSAKNPTIHIGGNYKKIGGNLRLGGKELFVTEACEYKRSFRFLHPYICVILNAEKDHPDYFLSIDDIERAFAEFAAATKEGGVIVVNGDDACALSAAKSSKKNFLTFGLKKDCDFCASCLTQKKGLFSFVLNGWGEPCKISLAVAGKHNVYNALAAAAAASYLGIEGSQIKRALEGFEGVDRRFEKKGMFKGATIINDYAHHPTELKAALGAARKATQKKVYAVFQPHTYSRTIELFEGFVGALCLADDIFIVPTYAAREAAPEGFSEHMLCDELKKRKKNAVFCDSFEAVFEQASPLLKEGDILINLGAGDIERLADYFVKK